MKFGFIVNKTIQILFIVYSFSCFGNVEQNSYILRMLKNSPIVNSLPMREYLISRGKKVEFDNPVFLITLASGIQAVFKPCIDNNDMDDCYAEIIAYKACQFFGFDFVPPTVIRTINANTGSLQLFIETEIDALDPCVYALAIKRADAADIANLKIFYFVFGQWDTGPHNLLMKAEGDLIKLIAIDNSGICNRQYVTYGELPFVRVCYNEKFNTSDFDQPFPFKQVSCIHKPTEQYLNILFQGCVPQAICRKLSGKKSLYYIIYQNSLWLQFHAEDNSFEKSFTTNYCTKTMSRLKTLSLDVLKNEIFNDLPADSNLLKIQFLSSILERRDQVLDHYNKTQQLG